MRRREQAPLGCRPAQHLTLCVRVNILHFSCYIAYERTTADEGIHDTYLAGQMKYGSTSSPPPETHPTVPESVRTFHHDQFSAKVGPSTIVTYVPGSGRVISAPPRRDCAHRQSIILGTDTSSVINTNLLSQRA